MHNPSRARTASIAALGLAAAVSAAACSSASHTSSAPPGAPGYGVLVEGTFSGPLVTNTSRSTPAVQAAFAGSGARVIVCDNQGTPAGQLVCEHRAVADHVAAVVPTSSQVDESVLAKAGIPVVGITDGTSPVSFEVSGAPAVFAGMGAALWGRGCRRLGFVGDQFAQIYSTQVERSEPWQSVTTAFVPDAAPDLSAAVAKLKGAGAQCVAEVTLPGQIVQLASAVHQAAYSVPVAIPGPFATPQLIHALGPDGNGVLAVLATPDPSFGGPAVAAVSARIKAYDPSAGVDQSDLYSWSFAQLVRTAATAIHGPVTAQSMLATLNGLRQAGSGGIYLPVSMVPRGPAEDRRDFDTNVLVATIDHGGLTRPGGWQDVGPELDRAVG